MSFYKPPEGAKEFSRLIGANHRRMREGKGLSATKQAAALRAKGHSIHSVTIYNFEAGKTFLSVAAMCLLYGSLGVSFPSEVISLLPIPESKEEQKTL